VALDDLKNARLLSRALEKSGYYTILSDIHRKVGATAEVTEDEENVEIYEPGLPVVAFRFSDKFKETYPDIQQRWIQTLLRAKGWIVPNYELAPDLQKVEILRVVIREHMTEMLVDQLVADLIEITESLAKQDSPDHGLTALGHHQHQRNTHERAEGRLEIGEGAKPSGTYARPC